MALATADLYPADSSLAEGRLAIGGCDAVALAERFGTPAYVLAERDLRERARAATGALAEHHDGPGRIVFASKALPCTAVLRIFAEEGLGCDVASGGELHLALRAGFDPAVLYLHGNAKSDAELAQALDAGVGTIVLDHPAEAERLDALVGPRSPPAGARAGHARASMPTRTRRSSPARRGRSSACRRPPPRSCSPATGRGLELAGLHMHIGSQLFAPDPWRRAAEALAPLGRFATYDLGGGLGVPYTRDDRPTDLAAWVAGMAQIARDALRERLRARARARPRARRAGRRDALPRRGGQARRGRRADRRRRRRHVRQPAPDALRRALRGGDRRPRGGGRPRASSSASTASPATCWCATRGCPVPRRGDVLVVPVTGAYGHAMANNYNGVPRPPVVLCRDGEARLAVRRETYEDLHARDV